jgi:hypothetical protein
MYYQIEVGDKVSFANIKHLKLPTKTKHNIPLCLWGLNVDNKPVDKSTTFKVKYLSANGIVIEVNEFPNGLYFDKIWLEFAGTSIATLVANSELASCVKEYEPF